MSLRVLSYNIRYGGTGREAQIASVIRTCEPDVVVFIDVPGFNLRVGRKVREARPSIPVVHYVSPSVWAWRPGRAR